MGSVYLFLVGTGTFVFEGSIRIKLEKNFLIPFFYSLSLLYLLYTHPLQTVESLPRTFQRDSSTVNSTLVLYVSWTFLREIQLLSLMFSLWNPQSPFLSDTDRPWVTCPLLHPRLHSDFLFRSGDSQNGRTLPTRTTTNTSHGDRTGYLGVPVSMKSHPSLLLVEV